jgi:hypothetical protein
MLFYAGTKSLPGIRDGEGRLPVVVHGDGENSPRGDGDGGLSSDGEFPVAIFSSGVEKDRPLEST